MKFKNIFKQIITFSVLVFLLTWCFSDDKSIEDAKKELGIWINNKVVNNDLKDSSNNINDNNYNKVEKTEKIILVKPTYTIEELTKKQFIELDDLTRKISDLKKVDLEDLKIIITWKTKLKVDKITVSFKNDDSVFPNDPDYKLWKFNSWDLGFTYNASSKFKVLDYGTNEFLIKAYSSWEVSELLLTIVIPKISEYPSDNDNIETNEEKEITEFTTNTSLEELVLTKITDNAWDITCDWITNYLTEKINTWYYWNTCRDIIKDKAIWFFVIRLDWDHYVYEKHYIDYINNKYWVLLLEDNIKKWEWDIKDDIKAKNNEYKEKNDTYNSIEKADNFIKKSL